MLLAREQGLDVVAVAALVDRPLTSMIWLGDSGIDGIADLRGKTIATAGIPYQDAYLETILARAGLSPDDVKTVNVGLGLLPAILSGRADAMLGGFRNVEGVDLRLRGRAPDGDAGRPARGPDLRRAGPGRPGRAPRGRPGGDPPVPRGAGARHRGRGRAQPQAATEALLEANRDLDPAVTAAEVAATLPLLNSAQGGRPFGYMDPRRWAEFIGWMRDNGLIRSLPPPRRYSATTTCRGSSTSRSGRRRAARLTWSAAIGRSKKKPWA